MNDAQLLRYSRHILLPEWGIEGQQRLLNARVLIVGLGGLGSPAALYLAAAGVGTLAIADDDYVDLTNLQRQILHDTPAIGKPKVVSAQENIARINPEINVIPLSARITSTLLEEQVAAADVILDCSDNFHTRYALNHACVRWRKPLVSGAAIRFDGQVSVFDLRHPDSPCYHCLFPEQHPAEEERCAIMGVFAPLTGIIGATQAAEALKLIAQCGTSLNGRLLLLDALAMQWRSVTLRKDVGCGVCQ